MGTLYRNGEQLFNMAPLKNTYDNDSSSAASSALAYDLKQRVDLISHKAKAYDQMNSVSSSTIFSLADFWTLHETNANESLTSFGKGTLDFSIGTYYTNPYTLRLNGDWSWIVTSKHLSGGSDDVAGIVTLYGVDSSYGYDGCIIMFYVTGTDKNSLTTTIINQIGSSNPRFIISKAYFPEVTVNANSTQNVDVDITLPNPNYTLIGLRQIYIGNSYLIPIFMNFTEAYTRNTLTFRMHNIGSSDARTSTTDYFYYVIGLQDAYGKH